MAVYCAHHKLIFFANPQTASKAIALTMRERLGGVNVPPDGSLYDGDRLVVRKHHATYTQLVEAGLMSAAQLDALLKFTCVRNPFDQMVSKYLKYVDRVDTKSTKKAAWRKDAANLKAKQDAGVTNPDFAAWLEFLFKTFDKVGKMESGPLNFLNHADHVIRFEKLADGFAEVQRQAGIAEPVAIIEHNVTAARVEAPGTKVKKRYTDYYDPASVALVEKTYAEVLQRFGYRFGD